MIHAQDSRWIREMGGLHLGLADYAILDKINLPNNLWDCWEWTGAFFSRGYARQHRVTGSQRVHVILYEEMIGSIPTGLVLDHYFCNNKVCVNPYHCQPVTNEENIRRYYVSLSHCGNGHEYNDENTYYTKTAKGYNRRQCRICGREHTRAWKASRKPT